MSLDGRALLFEKQQRLELHTERLYLRSIQEEDAQTIVHMRSDPNVYKYFCAPHAITMREHLQWYKERYLPDTNRIDWLALCEKKAIGLFGLKRFADDLENVEISYLICADERGRGYAGEATQALLQWVVQNWHCKVVFANIHKENVASKRFIERMGFQPWREQAMFMCYRIDIEETQRFKLILCR